MQPLNAIFALTTLNAKVTNVNAKVAFILNAKIAFNTAQVNAKIAFALNAKIAFNIAQVNAKIA